MGLAVGLRFVAMHCARGERRQAKCDVLSPSRKWSRIANPFSTMRNDTLASRDIQFPRLMSHPQLAPQDDGVFVKFWCLSRLLPTLRAPHVGNAEPWSRGVDMADVFFDDFRFATGGFNTRRLRNQGWHGMHRNNRCEWRTTARLSVSQISLRSLRPSPRHALRSLYSDFADFSLRTGLRKNES